MKRAANIIVNIIIVWLIATVVGLLLLPRIAGWRFDTVLSASMEPALKMGSVVAIKPEGIEVVEVGDIIAFNVGELTVTHRAIDIKSYEGDISIITKGDAVEDPDMRVVTDDNLVGRVVFSVPYFGYLSAFMRTRLGIIVIIVIPASIVFGLEARNMWRIIKRKDSSNNQDDT